MSTAETGEVRQVFKPGMDNIVAGIIIGLLMISGGILLSFSFLKKAANQHWDLPIWVEKGESWGIVGFMLVIGTVLICVGIWLIFWVRGLAQVRVTLCSEGFLVADGNSVVVFPWKEIVEVQEIHVYERPPILKGAAQLVLPKMMSKRYVVKRGDGEEFPFSGTMLKAHTTFADLIKADLEAFKIPWLISEEHV